MSLLEFDKLFDTLSVAMSFFFWLIIQNSWVEEKVIGEICKVLTKSRGKDPSNWTEEALVFKEVDELVYLKAGLTEIRRLYPSIPLDSKFV